MSDAGRRVTPAARERNKRNRELFGPYPVPALRRVRLKNYKSIGACDVTLGPLALLVGQNGAGKSNFLDALRFTSDSLRQTVEYALRDRGGINEVRRRSRGHPTHFGARFDVALGGSWNGWYAYQIAARRGGTFEVQREECWIRYGEEVVDYYVCESGAITDASDEYIDTEFDPDRLVLVILSGGSRPLRRMFQVLSEMGFYSLNLDVIRELQNPDPGDVLMRDGSNLASVIRRLNEDTPRTASRIAEYLRAVVPGVRSITHRNLGPKETIEFRQEVAGDPNPWRYLAASVSDGTLRALGVLIAVFQSTNGRAGIPLVAIEEPEVAVHPGAAVRLMDALLEASKSRQVIVTTHSPDLLDHPEIDLSSVLAVESRGGNTLIGPVNERAMAAVRENLYTVGELLRLEQIGPDMLFAQDRATQLRLFSGAEA